MNPIRAYASTKWKKNQQQDNIPDNLDTILNHAPGNAGTDITAQTVEQINAKIQGNLRNLVVWELSLTQATWNTYQSTNLVTWLIFEELNADGEVVGGNGNTTLTNPQWNALNSYLTGNGFDVSSLDRWDTRAVLKDKILIIFQN